MLPRAVKYPCVPQTYLRYCPRDLYAQLLLNIRVPVKSQSSDSKIVRVLLRALALAALAQN